MGKGINGLVLKAMRASDYRLTVTSAQAVTDNYMRLGFSAGGLLRDHPVHPTQWVRLWIPDGDAVAQRGYTLCDQDADGDAFAIEFAIHDGPAARWAKTAEPGDEIEATVMGSKFRLPDKPPGEYVIFGDTASLPAINSLLDAIGNTQARVWLEWQHASDTDLPVHAGPATTVQWLERVNGGQLLRETAEQISCGPDAYAWIACDAPTTRTIAKTLRARNDLPKCSMKAQAYWR